jgi:hypothetical protein
MSSLEQTPPRQRLRPRFAPISAALEYAGVSRSRLYQWAHLQPALLRKNGRASLVDFDRLDEILNGLPCAELKAAAADDDA